jgi:hypothetical protein
MPIFTIEITVGKGEKAKKFTATADTQDMPLILMEAATASGAADAREALAEFLDLPADFAKRLTIRHLNEVATAIQEVAASPNAS